MGDMPQKQIVVPLRSESLDELLQKLPHGLMALVTLLTEGEVLRLALMHDGAEHARPLLRMAVAGQVSQVRHEQLVDQLLQLARLHFSQMARLENGDGGQDALPHGVELAPRHPMDWTRQPVGPRVVEPEKEEAQDALNIQQLQAQMSLQEPSHLLLALRTLNRLQGRVAVTFELCSCTLQAAEILQLKEWLKQSENELFILPARRQMENEVRAMLKEGRGYRLTCRLAAEKPLPGVVADHLCHAFYGSAHDAMGQGDRLPTWSSNIFLLRAVIPLCAAVAVWARHGRRPLPPARDAIAVGVDRDGHALHLGLRDRALHTYIIGNTGTGKSTLMLNMARQDMEAGRCVILFDPHGDLWEHMRRVVPPARQQDVLLCHLGDARWAFSVNVLRSVHGHTWQDANLVVNTLFDLFKRVMYRDVPEAFGPLFETLFRNAMMLLLMAEHPALTLEDFGRVFVDKRFRRWLLKRVDDPHQEDFWERIFPGLSGDWNKDNLTLYVTSKLSQILQNPLLKPVLVSSQGSLSFSDVLAEQRICLINFAKGAAGARDSSFVAGVLSLQLGMAAMAQGRLPAEQRKGACVYMDEFQNYATYILGDMLAESRKYGLHLTLAHQTLGQISQQRAVDDLRHDVLANTANKFIFRLGRSDAEALDHFVAPHFSAAELSALDDHHMVAVALDHGRTREPQLVKTPPPPPLGDVRDPLPPEPRHPTKPPAPEDDMPPPRPGSEENAAEEDEDDALHFELIKLFGDD